MLAQPRKRYPSVAVSEDENDGFRDGLDLSYALLPAALTVRRTSDDDRAARRFRAPGRYSCAPHQKKSIAIYTCAEQLMVYRFDQCR
jgi:hypothetical protein